MIKRNGFWMATAALLALAWAAPAVAANGKGKGKVYRWVDDQGVVHFGDAIPPEYSKEQHEILDGRGTRTTVNERKESGEPLQTDRDRALLATYASVEEIESVRDRRAGYLDGQNEVAMDRLAGLKARRAELEGNAARANELATIEQRIREYDAEIARRNTEIARIRAQFDGDIVRFRELRGLPPGEETAAKR